MDGILHEVCIESVRKWRRRLIESTSKKKKEPSEEKIEEIAEFSDGQSYEKFLEEKALLEAWGHTSVITYEEWKKIKEE